MAFPSAPQGDFAAVRAHSEAKRPARAAVLAVFVALGVVALTMVVSSGSKANSRSLAAAQLFEEPAISLGIAAHEALSAADLVAKVVPTLPTPAEGAAPVAVAPAAPAKLSLPAVLPGKTFKNTPNARWNYQMDNKLTWPPHATDYIPTGAYSAGYKGPYDNDYDWPDDTQVLRNDEWNNAGGVGCGMNGNSC